MTRWALSLVDGNGQLPGRADTRSTGPYRPRTGEYGSYTVLINDADRGWCLVRLGADVDLVAADADPDVRVLPDWTLDHILTVNQANQINTIADRFGIPAQASAGMTVRQILRWLRDRLGDTSWNVEV